MDMERGGFGIDSGRGMARAKTQAMGMGSIRGMDVDGRVIKGRLCMDRSMCRPLSIRTHGWDWAHLRHRNGHHGAVILQL